MVLTPKGDFLYVASSNNTITAIKTADQTIKAVITGFHHLQDIKAAPNQPFVYASNSDDGTVSIINTTTNTVVHKIVEFKIPMGLGVSKKGDILYVVDTGRDAVCLIDTSTYTLSRILSGFCAPKYMTLSPDNHHAYVLNAGNNTISTIQIPDYHVLPYPIPILDPTSIAVTPDNQYLYVGSDLGGVFKLRASNGSVLDLLHGFNYPSNISLSSNDVPKNSVKGHQVRVSPSRLDNEISWKKGKKEIQNYKIYRDAELKYLVATLPNNATKYTDVNVQPETTYSYFVLASYSDGFSSTIGSVEINPLHTPPHTPPKPPHPK
jgi:YVTN family beta-propeller protein